jgi:predicted ABC-type exoprotein transport system permease subunit
MSISAKEAEENATLCSPLLGLIRALVLTESALSWHLMTSNGSGRFTTFLKLLWWIADWRQLTSLEYGRTYLDFYPSLLAQRNTGLDAAGIPGS